MNMTLRVTSFVGSLLFAFASSTSIAATDCQNPRTQTDINQCASKELDNETKKINKIYNEYREKLNPARKQQLKEVQLAWIKFKDLACQFDASGVEGGSVHSMVLSSCLAEKTRQRSKELESLANCREGDLSC